VKVVWQGSKPQNTQRSWKIPNSDKPEDTKFEHRDSMFGFILKYESLTGHGKKFSATKTTNSPDNGLRMFS